MSILVPVYQTGITLTEVPDHISLFIELGQCKQHCEGCHSPHLWEDMETLTPLETICIEATQAVAKGANAIVLMGGTTNKGVTSENLVEIVKALSQIAPVCLYSGTDNIVAGTLEFLTWLKVGSYQKDLGGLDSPKTNQKFFRKEKGNIPMWRDVTYLFRHENIDSFSSRR